MEMIEHLHKEHGEAEKADTTQLSLQNSPNAVGPEYMHVSEPSNNVKLIAYAPRSIPPRTSAITFGWRIFRRTRASKLAVHTMIPIESNK